MLDYSIAKAERNGDCVTIRIQGHFSFPIYHQFREACSGPTPGQQYVIDLKDATYMDSSALGMLLYLREQAGGESAQIEITHASPQINKVLMIANFNKLFRIT
jgi:anti-anti-sigma factor